MTPNVLNLIRKSPLENALLGGLIVLFSSQALGQGNIHAGGGNGASFGKRSLKIKIESFFEGEDSKNSFFNFVTGLHVKYVHRGATLDKTAPVVDAIRGMFLGSNQNSQTIYSYLGNNSSNLKREYANYISGIDGCRDHDQKPKDVTARFDSSGTPILCFDLERIAKWALDDKQLIFGLFPLLIHEFYHILFESDKRPKDFNEGFAEHIQEEVSGDDLDSVRLTAFAGSAYLYEHLKDGIDLEKYSGQNVNLIVKGASKYPVENSNTLIRVGGPGYFEETEERLLIDDTEASILRIPLKVDQLKASLLRINFRSGHCIRTKNVDPVMIEIFSENGDKIFSKEHKIFETWRGCGWRYMAPKFEEWIFFK